MSLSNIPFGSIGIMEIEGERFAVRPLELRHDFGSVPTLTCSLIEWAFRESNARRKTGGNQIKNVIFNDPATVVMWSDGTKTVVKCQPGDVYSRETGLALCIAKKFLGNKSNFNETFKRWIPEETKKTL